jgi:PAS domain S-box-containing protein
VTRPQTLMDQLAGHVNHGDHLCVICDNADDRLQAAAQYIADGLERNEFVMYAADAGTTGELRRMLAGRGIDVDHAIARGALNLPTAYDAYLRDGEFNPDVMYEAFDQAITSALEAGYTGCRFAGEPVWAIDREELRPGLIEFERRLNGLFRARKAAGLCVYDRQAWPAEVVRDVLRTHPVAVVGDLVRERNPYFERIDLVDERRAADSQVAWMLSQLREVQTQDARLQIALEAGRLGSWELELDTDVSARSLRHDRIFGYDRAPPSWGYAVFIEHVLPEDRARVEAAFREAVESHATWHFECRIRRANDGAIRWIEAYGRPDQDAVDGRRPQRLLGIVADITERKEMEQALRDADRRKDEFLATLAHELRNPLAPILNALHFMRLRNSGDAQLQRMQEIIERQVHHLGRLVDDLLEVSRITTGRVTLQRERVELRSVLESAIEASQPLIDASGHTLFRALPASPVYLEGDPTRLTQVFLNVLNNAAKYTPAGGRIELEAGVEGGQVVVRIRDNGSGIAPELIPEIFEMFVQGHRSGERSHGGLGIGLPLARQLLELHHGTIEAYSEGPGRGSEFTVRLPASPAGEAPARPVPAEVERGSARARVLVVDDNVDAAETLAATLQLFGCEVLTCHDGHAALEAVGPFDPGIAILDIGLPGLSGYEIARRLRASDPELVLVALTGWGQRQDRALAQEAGFDLHRTKPADIAELIAAVMEVRATRPERTADAGDR